LLERTLVTHYLAEGYANRVEEPERLDPAGEGVSIARALHQLGARAQAIVLLGRDAPGRAYRALIAGEDLQLSVIYAQGATPSDTCILDTGNNQETHIQAGELSLGQEETRQLADAVESAVEPDDTLILAGPLPSGAPRDIYRRLAEVAHDAGASVVLAAGGKALEEALPAKPELVALSQLACEAFHNYPVRVVEDVVGSCHKLRESGADAALVELKENRGAVLVTAAGAWQVAMPEDSRGTTTGVWAATLAGFLAGRASQQPIEAALELGAEAAAYTADKIGVEFGSVQEVEEHKPEVAAQALGIDGAEDEHAKADTSTPSG
jgi:1-phosphofructokinase